MTTGDCSSGSCSEGTVISSSSGGMGWYSGGFSGGYSGGFSGVGGLGTGDGSISMGNNMTGTGEGGWNNMTGVATGGGWAANEVANQMTASRGIGCANSLTLGSNVGEANQMTTGGINNNLTLGGDLAALNVGNNNQITMGGGDGGKLPGSDTITPANHDTVQEGQQPVIKVEEANAQTLANADVVVKADGTIQKNGDALAGDTPRAEYRVAVEAGADQAKVDEAVAELKSGIEGKSTDTATYAPKLDDVASKCSEGLRNSFTTDDGEEGEDGEEDPEDDLDDGGDCPDGGGGGGGGGGDDEDLEPEPDLDDDKETDEETEPDVTPSIDNNAAVISRVRDSLAMGDYNTHTANHLGAYDMNFNGWFSSFFSAEELADLGNPPDPKKLQALMKSAKFKERMKGVTDQMKAQGDTTGADNLDKFMNSMAGDGTAAGDANALTKCNDCLNFMMDQARGADATDSQMATFFNKDIQDAAASSQLSQIAGQMGMKIADMKQGDFSKMALSFINAQKEPQIGMPPKALSDLEAAAVMQKDANYQVLLNQIMQRLAPQPQVSTDRKIA